MTDTNQSRFFDSMALPAGELRVWMAVIMLLCGWALWSHGRVDSPAEVRFGAATLPGVPAQNWRLDLNAAGAAELELLPGIGPRRAQAIITERTRRGAFKSVWELTEVPGLSQTLVQRLEPLLRVHSSPD